MIHSKHLLYGALFILAGLIAGTAVAMAKGGSKAKGDLDGIKEVKAVWDITVGDEKIFDDRMGLIKETAENLKKRNIKPTFVLAIHGPAAKYVTKTLDGTKYQAEKIQKFGAIQESMSKLKDDGMQIEVCAIALKRGKIEASNVREFAVVEQNVWENITALQNKGYAYMPIF